uniref:Uncharacterized protein ycf33 n=1 Tax=Ophidocladus simpliciusculus TaxID=1261574 RepID=A0A1Z1MJK2_9FLOR|nr:hypothetical protein [Ophidocladus simpliciusculus]ARW66069.1 hypothetical protein [Ophidocladus simpliciusculus]
MSNFWKNLYKSPRFLTSVFIGFFLTTFQPIFKLLKNKLNKVLFLIIMVIIIGTCYTIIRKMNGIK